MEDCWLCTVSGMIMHIFMAPKVYYLRQVFTCERTRWAWYTLVSKGLAGFGRARAQVLADANGIGFAQRCLPSATSP
jgi:hypothetical protein